MACSRMLLRSRRTRRRRGREVVWETHAAVIGAEYPLSAYPSPSVALGAVGTDAIFACPALTIDQSVSNFGPTFAYELNDENSPENFQPPVSFPYGAAHPSETPDIMSLPTAPFPVTLS